MSVLLEPLRSSRHRNARSARELIAWLAWLKIGGYAPASLDAYERTAADLINSHPGKEMGEFTDEDILLLLDRYPEKSRRIRKAHLSSWFKWAYRTDRIAKNPVDKLPVIKRHSQRITKVFSAAEQGLLESLPCPDGPLMTLMFEAGLRQAEARNMQMRNIDFGGGMVNISEGAKGGKDRTVPIVPTLAQAMASLQLQEGLDPDDYLWYDKPGGGFAIRVRRTRPIAPTSFGRWWYRCLDEVGIDYVKRDPRKGIKGYGNPHQARHTFATRWRERNLELDDLSQLMGHSSVAITSDIYVHTSARRVGERMFDLLGDQS